MHMSAEPAIESQEALNAQRGQEEWYRQSQRIDGQQKDALAHRVLLRRQIQDGRQDGADARGPSEGECEADYKRSPGRAAALNVVHAPVGVQRLDLENPGQMKTKQDDEYA